MSTTAPEENPAKAIQKPRRPREDRTPIRFGFSVGQMPDGASAVTRDCNRTRRALEDAVLATGRSIGVSEAATINLIVRLERHARYMQLLLLETEATATAEQKANLSSAIITATLQRERAKDRLGIDKASGGRDFFDSFYNSQAPANDALPEAAEGGSDE